MLFYKRYTYTHGTSTYILHMYVYDKLHCFIVPKTNIIITVRFKFKIGGRLVGSVNAVHECRILCVQCTVVQRPTMPPLREYVILNISPNRLFHYLLSLLSLFLSMSNDSSILLAGTWRRKMRKLLAYKVNH